MPLDPELAAYLESTRNEPPRDSLTVEQTRARMRTANALAGQPPKTPIQSVDLVLRPEMRARLYLPVGAPDNAVTVYFHGGRFISGDLESHDTLCRQLSAASSRQLLAIDYRLAPEHKWPAAVDDAIFAAGWAKTRYQWIAVAGDSAGANLAAVVASGGAQCRCQLLIYPYIDASCSLPSYRIYESGYGPGAVDMKRGWNLYLPADADRLDPRISPLHASDWCRQPPALVITAEFDTLRDEGEQYAMRLKQAGVPCRLRRYEGAIHGFITMSGLSRLAREAVQESSDFLCRHL